MHPDIAVPIRETHSRQRIVAERPKGIHETHGTPRLLTIDKPTFCHSLVETNSLIIDETQRIGLIS